MSSRSELADILKVVSNVLTELSDIEYEELLNGRGKLVYKSKGNEKNKDIQAINENSILFKIIKELNVLDSRNEAEMLLIKSNIKKNDLLQLTSYYDIYISNSMSKEKIIEKIVEATVGARVRSQAIKDTKIKNLD